MAVLGGVAGSVGGAVWAIGLGLFSGYGVSWIDVRMWAIGWGLFGAIAASGFGGLVVLRGLRGRRDLPGVRVAAALGAVAGLAVFVPLALLGGGLAYAVDLIWPAALFASLGSVLGGGLSYIAQRAPVESVEGPSHGLAAGGNEATHHDE